MQISKIALVAYVVLSLTLPYMLSGDRTMLTFITYVALTTLSITTALLHLRRWVEVE